MLFLAATTVPAKAVTTLDKLKEIPPDFWLRLGFAVLVIIGTVFFLRKVAKMNKVVLTVVVGLIVVIGGFNWIYERNEPAWATSTVSFLAGFLPTKGPPAKTPGSPAPQPGPAKKS
jgi:uncharacterized membrane protein HdeD (DUF308 family)